MLKNEDLYRHVNLSLEIESVHKLSIRRTPVHRLRIVENDYLFLNYLF